MTTLAADRPHLKAHLALTRLVNQMARNWWVFVWRGVFALIFCASALFVGAMVTPALQTSMAMASLVVIFGFFAFWSGMVELIAYARSNEKTSALLLIDGLVGTSLCMLVINFPSVSASSIPLMLSAYVVLLAVFAAAISIRMHRRLVSRSFTLAGCALVALLVISLVHLAGAAVHLAIAVAALCLGLLNLEIGREFQTWREGFATIPTEPIHRS